MCIIKVGQLAHLRREQSTRSWSRLFPALAFLGGILMAPVIVLAAGTLQWTAQLNGSGPVLGPFSTSEQALQALGAAVVQECASNGNSCPAASSAMQQTSVIAMTPNSKTYFYFPITPSTPTAWSCYVWSPLTTPPQPTLGPGCFTSEASLVASLTSMPGCFLTLTASGGAVESVNSWVTPAGDWSSQLFAESNLSTQVEII